MDYILQQKTSLGKIYNCCNHCSYSHIIQIMKKAISIQQNYQPDDDKLLSLGFPPRVEISIIGVPDNKNSEPLEIQIEGLNLASIFQILPG